VKRYGNKSLQDSLPVVVPVGGETGHKWGPWDTEQAAKKWILGHLVTGEGRLQLLRVVTRQEVIFKKHPKFWQALTKQEWDYLVTVQALRIALAETDQFAATKFLPRLLALYRDLVTSEDRGPKEFLGREWLPMPSAEILSQQQTSHPLVAIWISQFLEKVLSRTHLTFWVRDGTADLLPAVYCPDIGTAVAVQMIFNGMVRICPNCEKTFVANTNKQEFCGVKCRVARFRARKQEKGN